jgi:hypothetical protein
VSFREAHTAIVPWRPAAEGRPVLEPAARADGGTIKTGAHCAPAGGTMAARKRAAAKKGGKGDNLIISKARVKAATKKCNVGGDFYGALDGMVRKLIAGAEERAMANKRKTLKPQDL